MDNTECNEFYSLNNAGAQQTYVGVRRAKDWVGFFLPHLKQGFGVLDCGCGVGSITLDIAELVAPRKVIGVDMDEAVAWMQDWESAPIRLWRSCIVRL